MARENGIFSMKKIEDSTLELSAKVFFSLDKYQFKNMVENSVFAIIEKVLPKCLTRDFCKVPSMNHSCEVWLKFA